MKFIRAHLNGDAIRINVDRIIYYRIGKSGTFGTEILFSNGQSLEIDNSPAELDLALEATNLHSTQYSVSSEVTISPSPRNPAS